MRAEELPESIKRLNPQLFATPSISPQKNVKDEGEGAAMGKIPSAAIPSKIDAKNEKLEKMPKLNKTEARFLREWLAPWARGADCLIIPQPIRFFRLTGGGTYTPDFLLIDGGGVTVYEVKMKGAHYHGWEQGYDRYKRAALEFSRPWLSFVMATWQSKLNSWKIEEWEKVK